MTRRQLHHVMGHDPEWSQSKLNCSEGTFATLSGTTDESIIAKQAIPMAVRDERR
jgi:hypothetical protein